MHIDMHIDMHITLTADFALHVHVLCIIYAWGICSICMGLRSPGVAAAAVAPSTPARGRLARIPLLQPTLARARRRTLDAHHRLLYPLLHVAVAAAHVHKAARMHSLDLARVPTRLALIWSHSIPHIGRLCTTTSSFLCHDLASDMEPFRPAHRPTRPLRRRRTGQTDRPHTPP